jgi:hypothetical protein
MHLWPILFAILLIALIAVFAMFDVAGALMRSLKMD